MVGALESAQDGSSWGAALSDGWHVDARVFPSAPDAVGWLVGAGPARVLAHDAVVRQLGDVGLVMVKVTTSDMAAATATLRDAAADGLSWVGVLGEQLALADVSLVGGKQILDSTGSGGQPLAGVKAAAWALWSARTTPAELSAIF